MTDPLRGMVRDPHEWMRQQQERTAGLLAKAEQVKEELAGNMVSHASPDRTVTLTVNPGGGLTSLTLSARAEGMPAARLSALIMSTYNQATARVADRTLAIMAELTGPDSEAADFVRSTLPAHSEPDGAAPEPDERFDLAEPDQAATPPPPQPSRRRQARPPSADRPRPDEPDDFGQVNWTDH